jgi:parvulin-like peptidyl-prolyl isomerase
MRVSRPTIHVVAFGVLAAGAFTLGALRARAISAADITAVAVVDGARITGEDVEVRVAELMPSASYHGNLSVDRLLGLRRAALDELVLDELIYREALIKGKAAPADLVDAELTLVKGRFDSAKEFAAALHENGLSEDEFRDRIAKKVTIREARAAHARQTVTDADVADYYRQNSARFQRPEQAHLVEILVRADPADAASAETAERTARAVFDRISRGEDFGAVARASSQDEYRVKDGDMGFVHRGRLDETFDAAVFDASVGRLSMARSLYGYQVFKVLERRQPTQLSLEEARPLIVEGLGRQRREEALRAWHERLRTGADIEIRDRVLRGARPAVLQTPVSLQGRLRAIPKGEGQ